MLKENVMTSKYHILKTIPHLISKKGQEQNVHLQ